MRILKKVVVAIFLMTVAAAAAQSPEPPLSDTRLTVHTLLREDIFAGFLNDDMERFTRGEKNIDLLMETRPKAKSDLLAWKASAVYYRAVVAHENKRKDEFEKNYRLSLDLFAQAREAGPKNGGIAAILGGSNVVLAERLPKEYRAAAWAQAYEAYQSLWKLQSQFVERLPLHMKGELLGGLAQSAQRTGRTEEMNQYLDKIVEVMPNTPYESVAKKWKENPKVAANTTITCLSCHDGGRLNSRLNALNGSK